jgi:iron(III) transport system substrate-binding protein
VSLSNPIVTCFVATILFLACISDAFGASDSVVQAAYKEGGLLIYGSGSLDDVQTWIKHFSNRYPSINAKYHRQGRTAVYERIIRENRAGLFAADVYVVAGMQAWLLAKNGFLSQYISAERAAVQNELQDRDGYWTAAYTNSYVTAYNLKQVPPQDVPRSYEDLLLPKWKGKMGFRDDDYEWYATVLEFMGREKGLQYIRRLAQQQINFAGDSPLRIQLLCAGEYSLDIGIHFDHPESARKKGCPVNWVVLEPGYKRPPIAIALAKSPPHPSAARIFIDWMLSRDGQKVVTDFTNREPVRADVEFGAGVQKLKQFRFWKSNWDSIFLNLDEHQKAYRELFGLK